MPEILNLSCSMHMPFPRCLLWASVGFFWLPLASVGFLELLLASADVPLTSVGFCYPSLSFCCFPLILQPYGSKSAVTPLAPPPNNCMMQWQDQGASESDDGYSARVAKLASAMGSLEEFASLGFAGLLLPKTRRSS